jgi:hypothetical protein
MMFLMEVDVVSAVSAVMAVMWTTYACSYVLWAAAAEVEPIENGMKNMVSFDHRENARRQGRESFR